MSDDLNGKFDAASVQEELIAAIKEIHEPRFETEYHTVQDIPGGGTAHRKYAFVEAAQLSPAAIAEAKKDPNFRRGPGLVRDVSGGAQRAADVILIRADLAYKDLARADVGSP